MYEEMLNPGYNKDWRCKVLKDLEAEYDRLLLQADNFNLDENAFAELWEQRIGEHLQSYVACRKMIPHDEDGFPFCAVLHDELCLFELSECGGICHKFELRKK